MDLRIGANHKNLDSSGSLTGPCAPAAGMSGGMRREVCCHLEFSLEEGFVTNVPTEAGNFPVRLDQ